ncbi:hypothetical protein RhiirA1_476941 [Rhizophagus irregularis]|uniref:Uncharacterized protein n=1 Tax=Rhizophagus irregularis TaxID=588596 RepID=A0A2N0QU94_9GLOM|nr:hypothetical protein RhiirA1_476941 [Rhizophagus irregularis]
MPKCPDEIKKYKTHVLIKFLQKEEDLKLDDDYLEIIRKEKVNGRDFFKLTKEKLAKECKERKKCSFSSYKTLKDLKEVLAKYGIDGNGIGAIRQFPPSESSQLINYYFMNYYVSERAFFFLETYTLEDNDEELIQCVKEIKRRLGNMGTLLADSNEAMRTFWDALIYKLSECISLPDSFTDDFSALNCWDFNTPSQNLVQCESALQVNKKRKADTAFREDFDYIYIGISSYTLQTEYLSI